MLSAGALAAGDWVRPQRCGRPIDPGAAPFDVTVAVDATTRFQTMQGYGAAVAFEIGLLANQPNRDEINHVLFNDLGIQILRVANWYQNSQARGNPERHG